MNSIYFTATAATLKAVLCFIDPENTPKIAYDSDLLAIPLINKVKQMVGDKDGSQYVQCKFDDNEMDLLEQFHHICDNISYLFDYVKTLTTTG